MSTVCICDFPWLPQPCSVHGGSRPKVTEGDLPASLVRKDAYQSGFLAGQQQAEAENASLRTSLSELVDAADWYRRCLEDVIDRNPVRGLDEARVGYDAALSDAADHLTEGTDVSRNP